MSEEIEKLKQEIAELRQKLHETDDWACGVYNALEKVLPFLLRGHPEVEKVAQLLKSAGDHYENNPHAQDRNMKEPMKMLYQQLAMLGVWPGVDPHETAKSSLERHRK